MSKRIAVLMGGPSAEREVSLVSGRDCAGALREAGYTPGSQQLVSVAQNPTVVEDPSIARQAIRLFEQLDEYDDTMNVFTNFEVAEAVLAGLDA